MQLLKVLKPFLFCGSVLPAGHQIETSASHAKELIALNYAASADAGPNVLSDEVAAALAVLANASTSLKATDAEPKQEQATSPAVVDEATDTETAPEKEKADESADNAADAKAAPKAGAGRSSRARKSSDDTAVGD